MAKREFVLRISKSEWGEILMRGIHLPNSFEYTCIFYSVRISCSVWILYNVHIVTRKAWLLVENVYVREVKQGSGEETSLARHVDSPPWFQQDGLRSLYSFGMFSDHDIWALPQNIGPFWGKLSETSHFLFGEALRGLHLPDSPPWFGQEGSKSDLLCSIVLQSARL